MSYPNEITATLQEISGNSCGTPEDVLEFDSAASNPEYDRVNGDLAYSRAWRIDFGSGQYTWQLKLRYLVAGSCRGLWTFQREIDADDPTGTYGLLVSGSPDTTAGKAVVAAV